MDEEKKSEENDAPSVENSLPVAESSKESSKFKKNLTEKLRANPFILSTAICGVLAVVLLIVLAAGGGMTGNAVSENVAGDNWVNYLESIGYDAEILDVELEDGLYKITFTYDGEEDIIYLTPDGENYAYLVSLGLEEVEEEESAELVQSDKPVVELFVMSYCPYGTQAEKGIIPAIEVLGDSVEFRIRFVDYLMHGETEGEENLREYCIQEIASTEEFLDYMYCFLEGDGVESSSGYITSGNDVDYCLAETGIDTGSLETCMTEADAEFGITEALNSGDTYPEFNVETDLNDEYGISGSPTLVINGVVISSSRDPTSYLEAICSAFTDDSRPDVCDTAELSSETPSVYFGWEISGSTSTGSC